MTKKNVRLNIVIFPPDKIIRKTIELSKMFDCHMGLFSLNIQDHPPHITLYNSDFPYKNLRAIKKNLKKLFNKQTPLILTSTDYHQKKDGFVDIGFRKTMAITKFHQKIAAVLNPLRENIPTHRERWQEFNTNEQNNILHWGYPEFGKLFRPHITLTRLMLKTRKINTIKSLPIINFSFKATRIVLFVVGHHGTGRKILSSYRLRKK